MLNLGPFSGTFNDAKKDNGMAIGSKCSRVIERIAFALLDLSERLDPERFEDEDEWEDADCIPCCGIVYPTSFQSLHPEVERKPIDYQPAADEESVHVSGVGIEEFLIVWKKTVPEKQASQMV